MILLNPLKNTAKNFEEYRQQLVAYISDYYPDLVPFFSDNTVAQVLMETNAAIGNNLNFQLDRAFQETQLGQAQQRRSLFEIAKSRGVKIPNTIPSVTVVDFTFNVPVQGDSFAESYLPIIKAGTQVVGGGQTFEVEDDIDFKNKVSNRGIPNRKFIPIIDQNNNIVRYEITKREIVFNGRTKVFKKTINESSDFMNIVLPDKDVISVEQIIIIQGTNNDEPPISDFFDENLKWYEVKSLAQNQIFSESGVVDDEGFKEGKWKKVEEKFTTETTANNFFRITFGNGKDTINDFSSVLQDENILNNVINGILNNNSLGRRVPSNSTVFVRYRVGGGSDSNIGANVINDIGFATINVNGGNVNINNEVKRTLSVNNPVPAIGGKDSLTNEEIRNLTAYNNTFKNSASRLREYTDIVKQMNGKFGNPYKVTSFEENNKVVILVFGIDSDGKLNNTSIDLLIDNIAEYISEFRSINDYVVVKAGKIVNIQVELDILIENNFSDNILITEINQAIVNIFDEVDIGGDLFIGKIYKEVNSIAGVVNLNVIKLFNIVDSSGELYSANKITLNETSLVSETDNLTTYEISLTENVLFADKDEILEIKDSNVDIKVNIKKRQF